MTTVTSVLCPPLFVTTITEYSMEVVPLLPLAVLTALVIVEKIVVRTGDDVSEEELDCDELELRELVELEEL